MGRTPAQTTAGNPAEDIDAVRATAAFDASRRNSFFVCPIRRPRDGFHDADQPAKKVSPQGSILTRIAMLPQRAGRIAFLGVLDVDKYVPFCRIS